MACRAAVGTRVEPQVRRIAATGASQFQGICPTGMKRQVGRGEQWRDLFKPGNRRVNDIPYCCESLSPGEAGRVAKRPMHPAEQRLLRLV